MDKLNNDCLLEIFSNISFLEKIKLELVCKKWYAVLQDCRAYSEATKLDISEFLFVTNSEYYQQDNINFVPLVKGIVQRGGPYVKEITFGYRWLKISQAILDHITEHCSQLKSLNLGCCIINGNLSKLLKKFAPQLEIFTLEESTWVNEDDPHEVSNYLSHFKAIKDLNLRKAKFNLDPIVHLPPYIECIDISASKQITGNALGYFFETHSHLKSFHMSPLPQSLIKSYSYYLQYDEDPEEGGLQTVIDSMKHLINLETLELGFIPHDAYSLRIDPISNLTSLKTLSLEQRKKGNFGSS
uniref:F-box domain-containing protein n=1 Tax=Panagrolaimus davidi TaxID=227884 RepID=A0A914QUI4_9BILA